MSYSATHRRISITQIDYYYSKLPSSGNETFKREAISSVFARLGVDMHKMLKENLLSRHRINLERDDSYTLHELQIALQQLLGEHGSTLLMREIDREIQLLSVHNKQ